MCLPTAVPDELTARPVKASLGNPIPPLRNTHRHFPYRSSTRESHLPSVRNTHRDDVHVGGRDGAVVGDVEDQVERDVGVDVALAPERVADRGRRVLVEVLVPDVDDVRVVCQIR